MTSSVSKWLRAVVLYYAQLVIAVDAARGQTVLPTAGSDAAQCPNTCFCNPLSRIVYCSRRGLDAVPASLPRFTVQLNVNGNHFRSPVLRRANFSASQASNIQHLYLSDCAIESIEVNTFADLTNLRWLDLSDNRLREIPHRAFYGVTLQHLFLNGNQDIRLQPGSFDGLVTSGLYLHDCALQVVLAETLLPLNGTLVNLWLNGNRLTGVDQRLASIFSQLSHLRLGANPLHCGCEALWLKRLYDRHGGAAFRGAEPPTCWTPTRLRARPFDQLTSADLHCAAPSFGNIDAVLHWQGTGRLRCTATGQPTPTIYWIRPSGRTRRFDAKTLQETSTHQRGYSGRNEGVVTINYSEAESGLYICVAKNEVGNVTLTMNVSVKHGPTRSTSSSSAAAAASDTRESLPAPHWQQSATLSVINVDTADVARYDNDRQVDEEAGDDVRLFTVSELVAAVVGTHLCTVLLFCVVLLPVYCVRAESRRRRTEAADSLRVYDSMLNNSELKSTTCRSTTVQSYHWPERVDYDVS